MGDMEDASRLAGRALEGAESFLLKQEIKKQPPAEKLPDTLQVREELKAPSPHSLPKRAWRDLENFFKGPMRFLLGATALTIGTAGFVALLPLALIGTGLGAAVGFLFKKGLKNDPQARSADRLGAAAGATLGSLGAPVIVAAGLKLMADAAGKKDKPPRSEEQQQAKAIVDSAVHQATSTLNNPTGEEVAAVLTRSIIKSLEKPIVKEEDDLTKEIKEALKEEGRKAPPSIKPTSGATVAFLSDLIQEERDIEERDSPKGPSAALIADELHGKMKGLSQEREIQVVYSHLVTGESYEALLEGEGERAIGEEGNFDLVEKFLELPEIKQMAPVIEEPSLNRENLSYKKGVSYVDKDLGLEFNLTGMSLIDELDKPAAAVKLENLANPSAFQFFAESAKKDDLTLSRDKMVSYLKPSPEIFEGLENTYLNFLDLALKDNPHYQGPLDEKEVEAELLKAAPRSAILYYDAEEKDLTIARLNKNQKLEKAIIEATEAEKMKASKIISSYRLIEKPEVTATEVEEVSLSALSWKEKNVEELQNEAAYHGEMTTEAAERDLQNQPVGTILTYYDTDMDDVVFAFKDELNTTHHLIVGDRNFETVMDPLIAEGNFFLLRDSDLTPGEKKKIEIQDNPNYFGEMSSSEADAILMQQPEGRVITFFDPVKNDIVLSVYSEAASTTFHYDVGDESFEAVKRDLINEGKQFLLDPNGGDKTYAQASPYYHGELTQEEVANLLGDDEVVLHFDPSKQRVFMSSWENVEGVLDFKAEPLEVEGNFESLKNKWLAEGKILLSNDQSLGSTTKEDVESAQKTFSELIHLHLNREKTEEYLNKFDKGIILWKNPATGLMMISYKKDGVIKHLDQPNHKEWATDRLKLEENHYKFLRPIDLNKIIPKTLPKTR